MKLRTDFVTNSSSSSFVAIANGGKLNQLKAFVDKVRAECKDGAVPYVAGLFDEDGDFGIGRGETEFGWEQCVHNDVDSKLNYLLIQCGHCGCTDRIEQIKRVFADYTGVELDTSFLIDKDMGELDHQSVSPEIVDVVFTNDGTLRSFLFNDDSVVIQGNDNSDPEFNDLDEPYRNNKKHLFMDAF